MKHGNFLHSSVCFCRIEFYVSRTLELSSKLNFLRQSCERERQRNVKCQIDIKIHFHGQLAPKRKFGIDMKFRKSKNNEKNSFARYLIGKAFNPPKSIIDYSTFYLLFLFISWNISSGCQDALFEHSTCAPVLSHENLVLVWQRQTSTS